MSKPPKGIKGFRRKLRAQKEIALSEIKRAMRESSLALDQQAQEIIALKRILISERAQVIYYTDKYQLCMNKQCLDLAPIGFLDCREEVQELFIKRAVQELSDAQGLVPHDPEGLSCKAFWPCSTARS